MCTLSKIDFQIAIYDKNNAFNNAYECLSVIAQANVSVAKHADTHCQVVTFSLFFIATRMHRI